MRSRSMTEANPRLTFSKERVFPHVQRADDCVEEDASLAIERHPEIDASRVDLIVKDGVVTLSGIVDDHRSRRAIEGAVSRVPGVISITNHLTLIREAAS